MSETTPQAPKISRPVLYAIIFAEAFLLLLALSYAIFRFTGENQLMERMEAIDKGNRGIREANEDATQTLLRCERIFYVLTNGIRTLHQEYAIVRETMDNLQHDMQNGPISSAEKERFLRIEMALGNYEKRLNDLAEPTAPFTVAPPEQPKEKK